MVHFKSSIMRYTYFCALYVVYYVVAVQTVDVDDILTTEVLIRQSFNKLFATFKIKNVQHNRKLKEFSLIHNSFISITLHDGYNLKRILDLSRVHTSKNIIHFISQLDEIINEDDENNNATDNKYVDAHIVKFIKTLGVLKKPYEFNSNFTKYSINGNIIEHLNKSEIDCSNDTEDYSEEVWRPPNARRIYQGHRTRIKHYPFIVSVHCFERFQCVGSIIQKDLVITAASCLQLAWNNRFFRENPAFLSILVGTNYYDASGDNIPINEIYFHPEYTPKTLANNLALMRLSRHIKFSKRARKVKRIEYDRNPAPMSINTDGIIIIGWGAQDRSNIVYDPWVNKLNYAELGYYSLLECQEVYSKEFVSQKNFCAGFYSKAGGACQHDIGGPGLSGGILVGVISFGPPTCGTPDAPTVFTKVGYYADWIDEVIDLPVPVLNRRTTSRQPRVLHIEDDYFLTSTTKRINVQPMLPKNVLRSPNKSLRILADEKQFDEFLSTLFSNNDKDHTEPSYHEATRSRLKRKKKNFLPLTPFTTTTEHSSLKFNYYSYEEEPSAVYDVNMRTEFNGTVERDPLESKTNTTEIEKSKFKNNTNQTKAEIAEIALSDYHDSKLENDIAVLLDDIDIRKILHSEEIFSSSEIGSNITESKERNQTFLTNIDHRRHEPLQIVSFSSEENYSDSEGLAIALD